MVSEVRHRLPIRWLAAGAASVVACLLWFACLNRDGCWLFWHGITSALIGFSLAWAWFLMLFGLRLQGRLILGVFTVLVALFWPHHEPMYIAAAESSAVGQLRRMQFDLKVQSADRAQEYPEFLPNRSPSSLPINNAFTVAYVPMRSADGKVAAYLIQATPLRRNCGCTRSFAITETGEVHYTSEVRAATQSDHIIE